jgi:hypothetical protein
VAIFPDGRIQCGCLDGPCEFSPVPICDGVCTDPSQDCRYLESLDACGCDPPIVPCEQSLFPDCDGGCPPNTYCVPDGTPGIASCRCEPIPCELSIAPTCDGGCPIATQTCIFDTGSNSCTCDPPLGPCDDQTPFPICDGICPLGTQCTANTAGGFCECVPTTCEQGPFPTCDGFCPSPLVCKPADDGTGAAQGMTMPTAEHDLQKVWFLLELSGRQDDDQAVTTLTRLAAADLSGPEAERLLGQVHQRLDQLLAAGAAQPGPTSGDQGSTRDFGVADTCDQAIPVGIPSSTGLDIDPNGDHEWFVFTVNSPTGGATLRIETITDMPGTYTDDTVLALYRDCVGGLPVDQLAWDDDSGVDYMSLIHTTCLPNGTYYVDVGGFLDIRGADNIELEIEQTSECFATGTCFCEDPGVPCDQSPYPTCDGDCPPGTICRAATVAGVDVCQCEPVPCELSVAPTCDGPCPQADQTCKFIDTFIGCVCDPPIIDCGQSLWPSCLGLCPPGTACVPDAAGFCDCLPIQCELSPFPACDGDCPPGTSCTPDTLTGECRCVPPPCEQSLIPDCDGPCLADPTQSCVYITSLDECRCDPPPPSCEQSPFPYCDGDCPPGTVCVPDGTPGAIGCKCEPIRCELSPIPVCDGDCPDPGQTCFFDDVTNACSCDPPPPKCETTPFPVCDGDCPPGTTCRANSTTSECECVLIPCDQGPYPTCDGDCPVGSFCQPTPAGTCECLPQRCEDSVLPECNGTCPTVGQDCIFDIGLDACRCDPPNPCDQSPFPDCDGDCPPGTVCTPTVDAAGNVTCECTPLPCELSPLPECDGPCPDPTQSCVFIDAATGCRCDPPIVSCDQSPWPTCNGDCPPGTVCVPDSQIAGQCNCEPIPCEQSPWPTCNGDCPVGTSCTPLPGGGCECLPIVPCEDTMFPACDGDCPPDERCVSIPGTDRCECEPIPDPRCEDTFFPTCEGACPTAERCTPGDPGQPCSCQPCVAVVPDDNIWILFPDKTRLTWTGGTCALSFNVYRQTVFTLVDADANGLADDYGSCFLSGLLVPEAPCGSTPPLRQMNTYLVTGKNGVGEGSMGFNSNLQERPNLTPCP